MPPLPPVPRPLIVELQKIFHSCDTMTLSSAEALVFLGFNITMRYTLHGGSWNTSVAACMVERLFHRTPSRFP
jgi:hypothetical protein